MSAAVEVDPEEDESLLADSRRPGTAVPARAFPRDSDTASAKLSDAPIPGFRLLMTIVLAVVLLAESARGIVIPTLSLYVVEQLHGSQFLLGLAIALFSVGRLIASWIFGILMDRDILPHTKHTKDPKSDARLSLAISLVVVCVGHALYLTASAAQWLWLVLVSRTCTGFGTGVLAVARTVVSQWTTSADRVYYVSLLSILQYVGFSFTPWLGGLPISLQFLGLNITPYTFGSLLLLVVTLFVLGGIIWYWLFYPLPGAGAGAATAAGVPTASAASKSAAVTTTTAAAAASDAKSAAADAVDAIARAMQSGDDAASSQLPPPPSTVALAVPATPQPPAATNNTAAPTPAGAGNVSPRVVSINVLSAAAAATAPASKPVAAADESPNTSSSGGTGTGGLTVFGYHRLCGREIPGTALAWFFVLLNGVTRGTLSVAETYAAQVYFHVYDAAGTQSNAENSADVGNFMSALGVIGLAAYLGCSYLTKRFGEVKVLNISLAVYAIGFCLLMDFGGSLPLTPLRMWAGMILVWSLGSTIAQTVIISLFTKCLQSDPITRLSQGKWIGGITSAGSIGRIIFPFLTGSLITTIGRGGVFAVVAVSQVALSLASWHQTPAMNANLRIVQPS